MTLTRNGELLGERKYAESAVCRKENVYSLQNLADSLKFFMHCPPRTNSDYSEESLPLSKFHFSSNSLAASFGLHNLLYPLNDSQHDSLTLESVNTSGQPNDSSNLTMFLAYLIDNVKEFYTTLILLAPLYLLRKFLRNYHTLAQNSLDHL